MSRSKKILLGYLNLATKLQINKSKNAKVVLITGTVGKTSVKDIIVSIIKQNTKSVLYSKKSYNSDFGIPFTIFNITSVDSKLVNLLKIIFCPIFKLLFSWKSYKYIVIEKGVQEPKDMDLIKGLFNPSVIVITALANAHTEFFASKEQYYKEKLKILKYINKNTKVLLNSDFPLLKKQITKQKYKGNFMWIGKNNVKVTKSSIFVNNLPYRLTKKFPKEYYTNIALAIEACNLIKIKDINKGLKNIWLTPGRFNIFKGINKNTIIDSTYNASFESNKMMLNFLGQYNDKKRVACLGDMRELGSLTKQEHLKLIPYINKNVDQLYLVGEEVKKYLYKNNKLNVKSVKHYNCSNKLGSDLAKSNSTNCAILFKGSQNTIFLEEAIKPLLLYPKDKLRLCRQSDDWLNKKVKFFKKCKN